MTTTPLLWQKDIPRGFIAFLKMKTYSQKLVADDLDFLWPAHRLKIYVSSCEIEGYDAAPCRAHRTRQPALPLQPHFSNCKWTELMLPDQ